MGLAKFVVFAIPRGSVFTHLVSPSARLTRNDVKPDDGLIASYSAGPIDRGTHPTSDLIANSFG